MKWIAVEFKYWLAWALRSLPGEIGIWLRSRLTPCKKKSGIRIKEGVVIERPSRLVLGENVEINRNCNINAGGGITIGNDTLIGPNVLIYSQNHHFRGTGLISSQGYDYKPVSIGNNVWIAANVVILPGVTIGDGAVVAAGSIVTTDVPARHLVFGERARNLRPLDPQHDAPPSVQHLDAVAAG